MKAKIKQVVRINGALALLGIPAAMAITRSGPADPDFIMVVLFGTGIAALLLAAGNLLFGLFVAVSGGPQSETRQWGQAMMICGAILLLCSGTLCSVGGALS